MKLKSETPFFPFPSNRGPFLVLSEAERIGAITAFSTRLGGCSPVPFDSFNFSQKEGDTGGNVAKNLKTLGSCLGIRPHDLVFCEQTHEDRVVVVESAPKARPNADAIICTAPGLFPAVLTADCLPILLVDPVQRIAAAVHAGWKGTLLGIAGKVLRTLKSEFRSDPSDLLVALGPAIGPCCYEVGDEIANLFERSFSGAEDFIISLDRLKHERRNRADNPGNPLIRHLAGPDRPFPSAQPLSTQKPERQSYRLDLVGANRFALVSEGVPEPNIRSIDLCTACYPGFFFSHRRDQGQTGRHIALVGWKR